MRFSCAWAENYAYESIEQTLQCPVVNKPISKRIKRTAELITDPEKYKILVAKKSKNDSKNKTETKLSKEKKQTGRKTKHFEAE